MKRRLSLLFLLALTAILFCACFGGNKVTFQKDGLSLSLPAGFTDKSGEAFAKNLNFLYTYGGTGFLGIREKRSDFPAGYENMGLEAYGKFVILGNKLDCELQKKDGLYTFTYEVAAPEGSLTYVAIVLEDGDAYWTVQGYCLSSDYTANETLIWNSLKSAKIS